MYGRWLPVRFHENAIIGAWIGTEVRQPGGIRAIAAVIRGRAIRVVEVIDRVERHDLARIRRI